MFATGRRRVKRWLARRLWEWSMRLGMDQEAEIEEAVRSLIAMKLTQYGPAFEKWLLDTYPQQVTRAGEARNTHVTRARRV